MYFNKSMPIDFTIIFLLFAPSIPFQFHVFFFHYCFYASESA